MGRDVLQSALDYHKQKICILPLVLGQKVPKKGISWLNEYLSSPQTPEKIRIWFADDHNIGWIAGKESGNLVIIDFDSLSDYKKALQNERFAWIVNRTAVSRRVNGRGAHVALRIKDFPVRSRKIGNIDIKGQNSYTLEPPSYLRNEQARFPYYWDQFNNVLEIPFDDFPFPEWFTPYIDPETIEIESAFDFRTAPHSLYGLGPRYEKILRGEYGECGFPSRSEAEFSLLVRCIGAKSMTLDEVISLFDFYGAPNLKGIQDKRWLESQYEKAYRHVIGNMSDYNKRVLSMLDCLAHENPFTGKSRHTDRAVIITFLEKCREVGPVVQSEGLGISLLELSERAGVSYETARKSVGRLFQIMNPEKRYSTNIYNVNPLIEGGIISLNSNYNTLLNNYYLTKLLSQGEDFNRHHALGKSGIDLIRIVKPGLCEDLKGWGNLLRLCRSATERRLKLLEHIGIVKGEMIPTSRKPKKVYTVSRSITPDDLQEIARISGTEGAGEKQKRRNYEQRKRYRRDRSTVKGKPREEWKHEEIKQGKTTDEKMNEQKRLLRERVQGRKIH